jgi:hypothetical protein
MLSCSTTWLLPGARLLLPLLLGAGSTLNAVG